MQSREHHLAPSDQIVDTLAFTLSIFFPKLFEIPIDRPALSCIPCLSYISLLVVHLPPYILYDRRSFRRLGQNLERVVEHRWKQSGRMSQPDEGHFMRC